MSPTFKKERGYTFKIYSNEEDRLHINVVNDNDEAKFWLEPQIELANNYGFSEKRNKCNHQNNTEQCRHF